MARQKRKSNHYKTVWQNVKCFCNTTERNVTILGSRWSRSLPILLADPSNEQFCHQNPRIYESCYW